MKFPVRRAALVLAIIASAILPNAGAAAIDEQALVVSIAEAQIGKPFRLGLEGPTRFDCSGLVHFVFSQAGLLDRIGGKRFLADEYYKWGRDRGLLSRDHPRVGDLILWTYPTSKRIKHMGIYVGASPKGRALAISALTVGVMRHKVDTIRFRSSRTCTSVWALPPNRRRRLRQRLFLLARRRFHRRRSRSAPRTTPISA